MSWWTFDLYIDVQSLIIIQKILLLRISYRGHKNGVVRKCYIYQIEQCIVYFSNLYLKHLWKKLSESQFFNIDDLIS